MENNMDITQAAESQSISNEVELIDSLNEAETALKLTQALCHKMVASLEDILKVPLR